ncbi:hypothetical protein HOD08_04175 [bacterium]|nr:hypothetical protein [bacterium]
MRTLKIIALVAAVAIVGSPAINANEALRTSARQLLETMVASDIRKCWKELHDYIFGKGDFTPCGIMRSTAYKKRDPAIFLADDMKRKIELKHKEMQTPSSQKHKDESYVYLLRAFREALWEYPYNIFNDPTWKDTFKIMHDTAHFLKIILLYDFSLLKTSSKDNENLMNGRYDGTIEWIDGITEIISKYPLTEDEMKNLENQLLPQDRDEEALFKTLDNLTTNLHQLLG